MLRDVQLKDLHIKEIDGFIAVNYILNFWLACEQALRGALAAGLEKEGELAATSLEFEQSR